MKNTVALVVPPKIQGFDRKKVGIREERDQETKKKTTKKIQAKTMQWRRAD